MLLEWSLMVYDLFMAMCDMGFPFLVRFVLQ